MSLDGAVFVDGDGVAQRLAVDRQRLVVGAMHGVPSLQGAVELGRVDTHEYVADGRTAADTASKCGLTALS